MKRWLNVLCTLILYSATLCAQEEKPKKWELSGYQKSLQGLLGFENPITGRDTLLTDIFLHNRLNFKWFPTQNLTLQAELRTRFFFGQFHQSDFSPNFRNQLKEDSNDILNLQLINTGEQTVLHSVFDRLYLEFEKGEWEVSLGRQRINWGIGSIWNPHDIFNAFSFLDFDYEERPGVDALRIKKYIGYSGGLEFAIKAYDRPEDLVAGIVYKRNKWNYDFQFLGGWAHQDVVVGLGWAGAIKNMGFKGEMSYFKATKKERTNTFTGTMEVNYGFQKGTFLNAGVLYNATDNGNDDLFGFQLEARNLYPFHWAITSSVTHPITPLLQGSMALIYSPVNGHPLFVNPSLSYNLTQNLDVDIIGQLFYIGKDDSYQNNTRLAFLRMKWSF